MTCRLVFDQTIGYHGLAMLTNKLIIKGSQYGHLESGDINSVQCYAKSHQPIVQAKDILISFHSPELSEESAALITLDHVS